MHRKLLSLTLFILICHFGDAQNHAQNWYFGQKAGISFSTYPVSVLTDGAIIQREGNATISDEAGNLLFYTDGSTIWNKSHKPMENGSGLKGQWTAAQSAIIAKQPGTTATYYVFTVSDWQNNQGQLAYSIVDMSEANGLGSVTQKNILINRNVREQISAVYADENLNVWILAHEKGNQKFVAYKLTNEGLQVKPIVSEIGIKYIGKNRYGQLKFSSGGKKVCSTLGGDKGITVQLFSFNQKTGKLSNVITISKSGIPNAYSSEFSPNNMVLYVTSFNGTHLYQYDLAKKTEVKIQESQIDISITGDKKSCLQIGYDHKIYISKDKQNNLGVIHHPNKIGKDCIFETNGVKMPQGSTCRLGFPNFIQSYFELYKNVNNLSNNKLAKEGHLEAITFNIYFNSGSAKLTEDSKNTLDKVIKLISNNSKYKAVVSSHTDCKGNADSNLKLSQKRAKSSASYINKKLKQKVNEGIGFGESRPAVECICEDCEEKENAQNRRTEIKLIPIQ